MPILRDVRQTLQHLRAPADLLDWIETCPDLDAAWRRCARADWLIYLAAARQIPAGRLIRAIAKELLRVLPPRGRRGDLDSVLEELCLCRADGRAPDEALIARIDRVLRPQIVEWNIHRQYPSGELPVGVPPPPPRELFELHSAGNAALRLEAASRDWDGKWQGLVLVALHLVGVSARAGRTPPFSEAELSMITANESDHHATIADRLRDTLR